MKPCQAASQSLYDIRKKNEVNTINKLLPPHMFDPSEGFSFSYGTSCCKHKAKYTFPGGPQQKIAITGPYSVPLRQHLKHRQNSHRSSSDH